MASSGGSVTAKGPAFRQQTQWFYENGRFRVTVVGFVRISISPVEFWRLPLHPLHKVGFHLPLALGAFFLNYFSCQR